MNLIKTSLYLISFIFALNLSAQESVEVKVFNKNFPTYNMGPEQEMPYLKDFNVPGLKFFRGSRSVYPYTFINDYRPGKHDKEYEVVRLENEFIYVDIIPELRGRIQGAVDKRNGWDFLYYNNVIKPAEISVRSAWISGGLEHNHPRGHGYTQFDKISYDIKNDEDGGVTIIIAEIEPVRMMKWEFEISLKPNQLYVETKGRFFSTAPFPVPMLSSNNAAMHTSDEMEIIMPQEGWTSGHAFKPMRKWPYMGADGADWTMLKNTRVQASAFADGTGLVADYWGVYSHDKHIDAGTVIVSDHRTAPGKKYFTWGYHDFGRQWDHFLSDEDGGYVELQQQAYFDNLGYGYAVLDPFEVKEFSVFWYPIMKTGGFIKATKEAAINFKRTDKNITIILQPTEQFSNSTIEILKNDELVKTITADLNVGDIYTKEIEITSSESDVFKVNVKSEKQREIMSFATKVEEVEPEVDMLPKKELAELTIDQLYYKGMSDFHDQYSPMAEECFAEILKRDPLESRTNRQLGIINIKRGQYKTAIDYLKSSLKNDHFESCYQTYFLIGYAYLQLGEHTQAHVNLVQSSRKKAWLEPSLYYLAQKEVLLGNLDEAMRYLGEVPISRLTHPDIHNLKAYVARKKGNDEVAKKSLKKSFKIDPLNFVAYTEKLMLAEDKAKVTEKINFIFDREDPTFLGSQLYLETALFYMQLNDFDAATEILELAKAHFKTTNYEYPVLDYYLGYCKLQSGDKNAAKEIYKKASELSSIYVFPYRQYSIKVLESVLEMNPKDAMAQMYYGDLMYYLRQHDAAISAWEKSYQLDETNARVARNLGVGLFVKTQSTDRTIPLLEKAFELSGKNRRVYNELEQMYVLNQDFEKLEKLYDENWEVIQRSYEFALNCTDLYLRKNRYADALEVLKESYFNAVEKGAGQPLRYSRYQQAELGLGEQLMAKGEIKEAIKHLEASYIPLENMNEIKVAKPVTCRADYLLGMALKANGQKAKAKESFKKAVAQEYNVVSEDAVYRAKAMAELGNKKEADKLVVDLLAQLQVADETAKNTYLKAVAIDYQGETVKAQNLIEEAKSKDKDVIYKTRFDSSYIKLNLK